MGAISQFPDYNLISLEDKGTVEKFLALDRQEMSECTFSNFYIWRDSYMIGLSWLDSALIIRTFYPDGRQSCLVPLGTGNPIQYIKRMCKELTASIETRALRFIQGVPIKPEMYFIPHYFGESQSGQKNMVKLLESVGFDVVPDRDNWDYVYMTKDLINLTGTKYHSKKKAIRKCLSKYKCVLEPISPKIVLECLKFQEEWCKQIDCTRYPSLIFENTAIVNSLREFENLDLTGAVIRIDGKIEALTIGERLNDNTAVIHFEKANAEVDGLYQVINNWFCREMLSDFEFVNREQDLGDPGLRRAKMSYHPNHMVEKYVAKLKA